MDKNELLILSHLRDNARKNLTSISKMTGIPVSTIFDKLKKYECGLIKRHTSLIDFNMLGFDVRVQLMLKATNDRKDELQKFIMRSSMVNSFYKINNGFDFMIEMLFRNMGDYYIFMEQLDKNGVEKKHEFFILQEIKRESFLSDINLYNMIN